MAAELAEMGNRPADGGIRDFHWGLLQWEV
jgi:hypothetical protein